MPKLIHLIDTIPDCSFSILPLLLSSRLGVGTSRNEACNSMRYSLWPRRPIRLLAAGPYFWGQTSVYPRTQRGGMDEKRLGRVFPCMKGLASYFPPDFEKKKTDCKQSSDQSTHVTCYGYLTIYAIVNNRTNHQFGLITSSLGF